MHAYDRNSQVIKGGGKKILKIVPIASSRSRRNKKKGEENLFPKRLCSDNTGTKLKLSLVKELGQFTVKAQQINASGKKNRFCKKLSKNVIRMKNDSTIEKAQH